MSGRKALEDVDSKKVEAAKVEAAKVEAVPPTRPKDPNWDNLDRDNTDGLGGMDKRQLMERIRFEVAQELGFEEMMQGELGEATTAQCGKFGALLRQRTQQLLEIRHVPENKHK